MFSKFSVTHIPALIVATTTTFGGIWPLFNAPAAMLEFGFPPSIANAPSSKPVMINGQTRTTVLGLLTFIFYSQGKYAEVDIILAVFGAYAGLVDAYVVWKLGDKKKAIFRLVSSWATILIASPWITMGAILRTLTVIILCFTMMIWQDRIRGNDDPEPTPPSERNAIIRESVCKSYDTTMSPSG